MGKGYNWRISEKLLLSCALLYGSLPAFGIVYSTGFALWQLGLSMTHGFLVWGLFPVRAYGRNE